MSRILVYILILLPFRTFAQPADFISVQKTGISDVEIVSENYYDGKSLWGYMNGGADLYLEYGFEGLLVQEVKIKGITVKCEMYKMVDPLSAFGIFSVQRHNCKTLAGYNTIHCTNKYQVQIVKGDYYLSVINSGGTPSEQATSILAAQELDSLITNSEIAFPEHPYFKHKWEKLIFLKGEISLSNVYPQALSYLDDISGYTMWILPSEDKKQATASILQFINAEERAKYFRLAFQEKELNGSATKKLKAGNIRTARLLNEYTILQAEGKIGKELKKILAFDQIK